MNEPIDPLHDTLADLMLWIQSEGLQAAVIGGVAAGLHGQPRLTDDVDAVVLDVPAEKLLVSGAGFGFSARVSDALEFSRTTHVLLMKHRSGVDLDISLGALPFEREVVERARAVAAGKLLIMVASPEDLIIMKALARRPQDIADIAGIIETQPSLDIDRIRHWVREFSAILEMPELLDDLEMLLRRRR
jgi:hypothetical protein